MDKENKKPLFRSVVLKASLIFVAAYIVSLVAWLGIKGYYGMEITTIASHAITLFKDVDIVSILRQGDIVSVGFIPQKYGVTILKKKKKMERFNYKLYYTPPP